MPRAILIALSIAGSLLTTPAHGQTPSLFRVSGDWIPNSSLEVDGAPEGTDTELRIATLRAGFNVPLRLTEEALLLPGASYDLLSTRQGGTAGISQASELHAVTASLLFLYRLSPRWSLSIRLAPSLAGDFVNVNGDHVRFAGSLLVSYALSEGLTLGGGVLFNNQFGVPRPLPAILVQWDILEELRFETILPVASALVWHPSSRIEVGLEASIRGQSYALTSEQACPDSADQTGEGSEACVDRLAYSRGEIGPTVRVRIASSLWLSLRVGIPFLRRYEILDGDAEDPELGSATLAPRIMVQMGLTVRLPGT